MAASRSTATHREVGHLTETVPLKDVLARREGQQFETLAVRAAAEALERLLGTPLLIELPSALQEFGLEAEEPLRLAKALYDRGIVPIRPEISRGFPDEPSVYRVTFGKASNGAHLFEPTRALWAAIAEYVERDLWRSEEAWFRRGLRHGTRAEIGQNAIDPATLAGFSEEQRSSNPELRVTAQSVFGWMPTTSLATGLAVHVPAQLMSARYFRHERRGEPMLRWTVTTGLATGPTLPDAILRGALEVIERDAFMITYLNQLSPPRIDLDALARQDRDIGKVLQSFSRYRLEPHILLLPSDFAVPVVAVAIVDRTGKGPALSIGAKADFSLREAIVGALGESLSVRLSLKNRTALPDDFPKAKITRDARLAYWLDPRRLPQIEFLLSGPVVSPDLPQNLYGDRRTEAQTQSELARVTQMLRGSGCDMYYAEMTSQEVREVSPLRCVFVMSPELQPLHLEEAIPYLGGSRLKTVPEKLGYTPAEKLNSDPHPFP